MKNAPEHAEPSLDGAFPRRGSSTAGCEVSVVICTRNGLTRGFIENAIDSVCGQTAPPFEIILVDDASCDGTGSAMKTAYPDLIVLSNAGSGLAAARNTGIKAARSRWIAFMDDDDVWVPEKLAKQMAQVGASMEPESSIWAARTSILGSGSAAHFDQSPTQYSFWPACLINCPVFPSGVLISRKLVKKFGPFNESIGYGAAHEFFARCMLRGITIRYSEKILLNYRRHERQMTSPRIDQGLTGDQFFVPHLETLPTLLKTRIEAVRVLRNLRNNLVHRGFKSAAQYFSATPLRPVRIDLRSFGFIVLDSAASRAPYLMARWLRHAAVRVLLARKVCAN